MSQLNIYQRMNAIAADAEVAKGGTAPQQVGGFAFHKIDDVEAVLKPLFIKHGVSALPTVTEREFNANGGWNITSARVDVLFTNVDNPEDSIILSGTGLGFDKQDKGDGKAISYATKNVYLTAFHLKGQPDVETDATDEHVPAERSDEPEHDAAKVVPSGKNAGKPYADLETKALEWYANNAPNPVVAGAARKELSFRGLNDYDVTDTIDSGGEPAELPV